MNTPVISSSILSADFTRLGEEIHIAQTGGVDWIHVDVMDGHFVPNLTMGPFIVKTCRGITSLPLDVHLMIENPERLIPAFIQAGASFLTVHVETCPHLYRTLESIREMGAHPAVALNPGTPAQTIKEVLQLVDMVLVMTVNPGYSGQKFIPGMLSKIREVRAMLDEVNPTAYLEVDGGITAENVALVQAAGADAFVAATAIFKHPQGIAAGLGALREQIRG